MNKQPFSRLMALVLSVALVFTMVPFTVSVKAAGCTHEHDAKCGYVEGHYVEDDDVEDDDLEDDDLENDLDEEPATSSNTKPTSPSSKGRYVEGAPCQHKHDELCGGLIDSGDTVIVAAFDNLDDNISGQSYDLGEVTSIDDLILPYTLTGSDQDGGEITIGGVTWECEAGFDPAVAGGYMFSAALPEGYTLAEGLSAPFIFVFIRPEGGVTVNPLVSTTGNTVTIEETDTVQQIKDAIDAVINGFDAGGGTVTVDGAKNNADAALTLTIPAGVTVVWQATLSGSVANLISLYGTGTFEVAEGGVVSTTHTATSFAAIRANSEGLTITVSGGTVSATAGYAISTSTVKATVNVSGGMVSAISGTAIYNMYGGSTYVSGGTVSTTTGFAINSAGSTVVSGTGKVQATGSGTGISNNGGNVSVTGGKVSATTGHAVYSSINNSTVIVSGGEVSSGTGRAIYFTGNNSTVTVSGGVVSNSSTDSAYPVIHMSNSSNTSLNVTVSNTGAVQAKGNGGCAIQTYGSVSVTGGEVSATTGSANAGRAISAIGSNSTVTVSGGTVSVTTGTAIYTAETGSKVTVSGNGTVRAMGTSGIARAITANGSVNITGGEVSVTQGSAIVPTGSSVTVSGGIVSATTGKAVFGYSANSVKPTVTVSGGLMFAYGTGIVVTGSLDNGVIYYADLTTNAPGVVVAWNKTDPGPWVYDSGTSNDLIVEPSGATVTWGKSGADSGIGYGSGNFFKITDVTVNTPSTPVHTATVGDVTSTAAAGTAIPITLTVKDSDGYTDTAFTGAHNVTVNGQAQAPVGTYGTFGGTNLTTNNTVVGVTFTAGVANVDLILHKAGTVQNMTFSVDGVATPLASGTVTVTPAYDPNVTDAVLTITTQPAAPATNGGALATQPALTVKDKYGNPFTAGSIVASAQNGWTIGGTTTASISSNGTVSFTDLIAGHTAALSGAIITFTLGGSKTINSSGFNIPSPAATQLAIPANVSVTNAGAVSWSAVGNASSYTVRVYKDSGTLALITLTGITETSRLLTNTDIAGSITAAGTDYCVTVTAIGDGTTYSDSAESAKSTTTFMNVYSVALTTSGYTSGDTVMFNGVAVTSNTTTTVYAIHDTTVSFSAVAGANRTVTFTGDATVSDNITNITANKSITAIFANVAPTTYAVTGSVTGGNGTVSMTSGTNPATHGSSATFTAVPNSGYQVKEWNDNGTTVNGTSLTYTISNITAAHTVTVEFKAIPPTVTNVTVSPSAIEVQKGGHQQFAATVTGTNNPATTVTWSIDEAVTAGTAITSGGSLTVASGETASTLTIRATSTVDASVSGTATVTVTTGLPTPVHDISLDVSETHTFPAVMESYGNQTANALTVTMTNTGNQATGNLTVGLSGNTAAFTVSATTISGIAVGGNDSFTVTPNTGLVAATYTATVTVSGGNGISKQFNVSFTVDPATPIGTAPAITTTTLPDYTVGTAYSEQLTATGDTPITWTLDSGSLPGGLTLSSSGVISGNPTTAGTFNFTVKATNATGSDTQALSIIISPDTSDTTAPTVTSVTPANGATGVARSGNIVITFSEAMNTSAGAVKLNSSTLTGTGTWSNGNRTYTIPYSGLAYSTIYTISITGFKDVSGNVMTDYTGNSFTTASSGSGGNSSGGSSSSGGFGSPRYNITTAKQHGMPKVATMIYTGTVQDNQLTGTITKDMVQADVNAAGTDPDGIALTFIITNSSSYNNQTISIAGDALDLLRSSGVKYVQVQTGIFRFHFDSAAIQSLDSQTTGTVTVSAYPVSPLSDAAKAAIGNRPVFDFTVHDSAGSTVTSYGSGTVTRGIRYTADSTENTGSLFIVKIVDGTVQWIDRSSYDNGWMIWSGDSNSVYGVGYKAPAPAFTDTSGHWAKDDIDFAASRGLISGTGATAFSPDTAITRADFLMALGRLSGADVSGYTAGSFTDVPAANPAMPYIEWAVTNNIVQGIGDNRFGPDHHITREQMAVIMVNYAEATNYALPISRQAVTFADDAQISAYAKDAVKTIQQTGVISGKADNLFDPQGSVTRAEAGTILRRFTKLVIDGNTARGWVRNDIGQWQYITPDGRTVTGWLNTANGIWYWFDDKGIMAAGEWIQISGKWYYFYDDGQMAANTTIDGYEVGEDGARKE